MTTHHISEVRSALQKFQDGYTAHDATKLGEFMQLFVQDEGIEMIGVGASKRAANEWFEGLARIREIVESDWKYWGDVKFDVAGARITVQGEAAWLSTTGTVTQTKAFDTAIEFHVKDMKAIFDRDDLTADQKLMEATHYGIRRMYERSKGLGHSWPFTFTAVFMKIGSEWRFHTIHWSMPVE
ncbi:MAG: hypothetical protein ACOYZ8_03395 [Chloroflexota bacterium]